MMAETRIGCLFRRKLGVIHARSGRELGEERGGILLSSVSGERREMDEQEQREKEVTQAHAKMAALAQEAGAMLVPSTYAWTGEFRGDGVLVPHPGDELGFSAIPSYLVDGLVGDFDEGFVVQQLFYAAPLDRYAVVEVVWAVEPQTSVAYPIGKPAPEGTAPLRYVEDGEAVSGGCLVAWDAPNNAPCPSRCRAYPEQALGPNQWMTEEEAREQFPHLWERLFGAPL
jgi:hypothetical protein